ncbi:MAG: methylmalonyl Co-A mutase-associated GTPase MeaB [Bacteroidia bacterium]|nr:methylmalonyl Co-A mutase-associated GTPase MeaB [Bacteroidia bacterium]
MEAQVLSLAQAIGKGDRVALARGLSLIESIREEDLSFRLALLRQVPAPPSSTYRIGFTGAPGAGKSTLIDAVGAYLLDTSPETTLAILTVDPSSWRSGGSLLADQTRMRRLSNHPRAFARTFASGGHLGGLHPRIYEAVTLCEAAGFTWIFIESVGTGQSEIELRYACDFLLYVALPHTGDEIQGLKRGLMEALDGIALNKADAVPPSDLNRAQFQLETALHFLRGGDSLLPFVTAVSALTGHGIESMWSQIVERTIAICAQPSHRKNQLQHWLDRYWEEALSWWLARSPYGKLHRTLQERLEAGEPLWHLLEEIGKGFGLLR